MANASAYVPLAAQELQMMCYSKKQTGLTKYGRKLPILLQYNSSGCLGKITINCSIQSTILSMASGKYIPQCLSIEDIECVNYC